jgi:hypothetical protein
MKNAALFLILPLFVSCGPRPDPVYVERSGNLAAFIQKQLRQNDPDPVTTEPFGILETKWSHRTITSRHKSGEDFLGSKWIEIQTSQENFMPLKSILTERLGEPTYVLGIAIQPGDNTNNHPRWASTIGGVRIWLSNMKTNCSIAVEVDE